MASTEVFGASNRGSNPRREAKTKHPNLTAKIKNISKKLNHNSFILDRKQSTLYNKHIQPERIKMSRISNLTKEELNLLVQNSTSFRQVLLALGYKRYSGSVKQNLQKLIFDMGISTDHFKRTPMPSRISSIPTEKLQEIINDSNSWSEVLKKVGYKTTSGDAIKTLQNYTKTHHLNTDAIKTYQPKSKQKAKDEDIFKKDSKHSRHVAKLHLIKLGYTPNKCEICRIPAIWQGKPLTLRLDHINGINNDHRIENLRWICPNCDSQLSTYAGRNKKPQKTTIKRCPSCGQPIDKKAKYCRDCSNKLRRTVIWPSKEQLIEDIKTLPMTKIGKKYGVSDNAIRKWCKHYDINYKEVRQSKNCGVD